MVDTLCKCINRGHFFIFRRIFIIVTAKQYIAVQIKVYLRSIIIVSAGRLFSDIIDSLSHAITSF